MPTKNYNKINIDALLQSCAPLFHLPGNFIFPFDPFQLVNQLTPTHDYIYDPSHSSISTTIAYQLILEKQRKTVERKYRKER